MSQVILLTADELSDIIRRTADAVVSELRDEIDTRRPKELMTKTELADYLRCDVSKINRYMTKDLPFEYFGDHPRFRKSDIDFWLKSNGHSQAIQREAA